MREVSVTRECVSAGCSGSGRDSEPHGAPPLPWTAPCVTFGDMPLSPRQVSWLNQFTLIAPPGAVVRGLSLWPSTSPRIIQVFCLSFSLSPPLFPPCPPPPGARPSPAGVVLQRGVRFPGQVFGGPCGHHLGGLCCVPHPEAPWHVQLGCCAPCGPEQHGYVGV